MKAFIIVAFCCYVAHAAISGTPTMKEALDNEWNKLVNLLPTDPLKLNANPVNQTWCTCGVFLSGQFSRNSQEPPKGHAALMHEQDYMYPCTPAGAKQCSNKCLETVR